ncbi:MAG TPA: hypothetical protein VL523_11625 [Terriglobia bacterium]|nr:hypothetical protein [Terriglobia bacterium]
MALPEEAWQEEKSDRAAERHCAEVPFVPSEKTEKKDLQPLRYVAVRVRKRQGELFGDGSRVKHFAGGEQPLGGVDQETAAVASGEGGHHRAGE